jgi:hypothetical protein
MVWITGLALVVDTVGTGQVAQYMSWLSIGMMLGTYVFPARFFFFLPPVGSELFPRLPNNCQKLSTNRG